MLLFEGLNFIQKTIMVVELAFLVGVFVIFVFKKIEGKKLFVNLKEGALSYDQSANKEALSIQAVVSSIFFQTLETVALMTQIKTKLILHDQMTYLEERMVLIKDHLMEAYRAKLKTKLSATSPGSTTQVVSTTSNQEYLFFKTLTDLMKEEMKSGMRTLFLRNNFSRYNEKELDAYVTEKNELLLIKALHFIGELYPSEKMLVSYDEVEEAFNSVRGDIAEELSIVFKKAVFIHNSRLTQITELETNLREKIKLSYGVEVGLGSGKTFVDIVKNDGRD